jgi:hypothetical protein
VALDSVRVGHEQSKRHPQAYVRAPGSLSAFPVLEIGASSPTVEALALRLKRRPAVHQGRMLAGFSGSFVRAGHFPMGLWLFRPGGSGSIFAEFRLDDTKTFWTASAINP